MTEVNEHTTQTTATTPTRILVVDDHTLFRRGLTALLSRDARVAVVGDAALRDERAGNGCHCQQQQQHQRGAHGRQLSPDPAPELDGLQFICLSTQYRGLFISARATH